MKHQFRLFVLTLLLLNISNAVSAQYNVVLGTDNVPITKVHLNRNGTAITQNAGNATTIQTTDAIILDSLLINDGGTKVLKHFNVGGAYITNNNFTTSVTGVGVYNQGVVTLASLLTNWESEMTEVVANENLLHYMFYDGVSNIPSGNDFDILWARAMTNDDYFVVSERNGNTYFTVTALGADGNVISGARQLRFGYTTGSTSSNGNNKYDWNIGYGSLGHYGNQPQYMSVVDISLFNTTQDVYGVRVDNNGQADVKFFGISETDMSNNPINARVPGISGNIFGDANGLKDNTVNGQLVDSAGTSLLYVSLVQGGVAIATVPVDSNGQYCFLNIDAGTYTTVLHTTAAGSATSGLPANWVNTGENDGAGTGSDGLINGISPSVTVSDSLETQINFGVEQLPESDDFSYTLTTSPIVNEVRDLSSIDGMGILSGSDNEDGTYGSGSNFVITDTTGLNGNVLFYDADNDGVLDAGEELYPNDTVTNYDPTRLSISFVGVNTMLFTFNYAWVDAAGNSDPTPATYTVNWSTPVPVTWVSFKVERTNNNLVQLNWATATEINNDRFEIQRKLSSESEFTTIAEVLGAGNSSNLNEYRFTDNINGLNGTICYRLKQVDYNSEFEYSDVACVKEKNQNSISVYPNPAKATVTIQTDLDGFNYVIRNSIGTAVKLAEIEESKTTIQTVDLPSGMYFIKVKDYNGQDIESIKLLIL